MAVSHSSRKDIGSTMIDGLLLCRYVVLCRRRLATGGRCDDVVVRGSYQAAGAQPAAAPLAATGGNGFSLLLPGFEYSRLCHQNLTFSMRQTQNSNSISKV